MIFIDTHVHIEDNAYDSDRESVIKRAIDKGVKGMIAVSITYDTTLRCLGISRVHPNIYVSAGVHPHDVKTADDSTFEKIESLLKLNKDKIVAVGETGLDFYRNLSPRKIQEDFFRKHINLAKDNQKPLIIHDRNAHSVVMTIMKEEKADEVGGVMHCFSGDVDMAMKCINMGFYVGIGGAVTFSKNGILRDVVQKVPLERLLLETDSPYLAPVPFRGKRNEPAYLPQIALVISGLKGVSLKNVADITAQNAFNLFRITL